MSILRLLDRDEIDQSLCLWDLSLMNCAFFQVLDALGESLPCKKYDSWMVYLPEGDFLSRIGPTDFFKVKKFSLCCYVALF